MVLYTTRSEELNSGLPRTNPCSGRVGDLNQGPLDFISSALDPLTSLLPQDYNEAQKDVQVLYLWKILFCLTDVAIGAPFEDNGAVYIYHGAKDGINPAYKQV